MLFRADYEVDAPTCTVSTETERRATRPSLCGLSNVSSLSVAPQDSPPQATTPTLGKNHQSSSSSSFAEQVPREERVAEQERPHDAIFPAHSSDCLPLGRESSPLLAALEDNNF
ncbi:hypothetical protein GE061_015798 [Apolygus lucorum]|uniref:Uncharacterized protein n=1 Tax=Apolygus lucorum TaxID=248454 RepID=A0A8S9XLW8_APOLU|nr:hypothetical protein GE061_015798 [Apolygus lucorum]